MNTRTIQAKAGESHTLVSNSMARGLLRTFTITTLHPGGTILIRRSPLPFFCGSTTESRSLEAINHIKRGFFDASFELRIIPTNETEISIS